MINEAQTKLIEEAFKTLDDDGENGTKAYALEELDRAREMIEQGDFEGALEPLEELVTGCCGAAVIQYIKEAE